jgi:16S rRNA (cytidine1402-2'-O)-methyltransferase
MTASTATAPGTLYIVATPIGNLGDITQRAITTLQAVDTILAEDTRHSKPLLTNLGIKKPLASLHMHNEAHKSEQIIDSLKNGQNFALISDAGTPLINDPGYPLVKMAHENNITVVPIPGACALIAALSAAGVASDMFTFAGFLPAKKAARQQKMQSMAILQHTLVFYESTHWIIACIADIATVYGEDTEIILAKELTKTFERFITGRSSLVQQWLLQDKNHLKGEFVLIIPPRKVAEKNQDEDNILTVLLADLPLKQAVKITAKLTGKNKNELYKRALELDK